MQVKVVSLNAKGFLAFDYKKFHGFNIEDLEGTMVLITGRNEDEPLAISNGAGKSSILEALSWGFYGKLMRRNQYAEEVIHKAADKAEVTIFFVLKSQLWKIHRTRQRGKGETLVLSYWMTDRPKGSEKALIYKQGTASSIQKILDDLLGMNHKAFCCSVIFGQESTCFPDLKPTERMLLLSEVRGLDRYTSAAKKARERANAANSSIQNVRVERARLEGTLDTLLLQDYSSEINVWNTDRNSAIATCISNISDINKDLAKERKRVEETKKGLLAKKGTLEKRQATLAAKVHEWDGLNQQFQLYYNKKVTAERSCSIYKTKMAKLDGEISGYQERIQELQNAKNVCPLCKSKVTPSHFKEEIDKLKEKIDTAKSQKASHQSALSQSENAVEVNASEMVEIQKRIDAIHTYQASYTEVNQELSDVIYQIRALAKDEVISQLETELKENESTKEDWENAVNPYVESENNRQNYMAELTQKIDNLTTQIAAEEDTIAGCTYWADAFKKIQYTLIEDMVASLESEVRHFMGEYSTQIQVFIRTEKENKTGTTKDEIYIIVEDDSGEVSYDMYSGGERQKVRMAIQMALSNLIMNSCGTSFNFQAFDEPNNGLDMEGKMANFRTFEMFAAQDKTVLVTDHDANFQDRFETVLQVVKKDGFSSIVMADIYNTINSSPNG